MGFGKGGTGAIIREDTSIALATLAAKTGILVGSITLGEDFRMLKSIITANIDGLTQSEGPFELYLVNGALTLAQCEEAIEANGPTDRNDPVNSERVERFVRFVGQFSQDDSSGVFAQLVEEIKPRWTFSNPEGWDWMLYNASAGNLTTGASVFLKVTHYGVWVT